MGRSSLKTYRAKRNFEVTPEPTGGHPSKISKLRFVIQKHAASHLHYDFRLEAEGVLKSWAVPKGPSTHAGERRLAMMTEDHPIDYANFEGTIPQGEYGGGSVIVWDRGRYVNLTEKSGHLISLSEGLERGHITFWLQGKKLNGAWSLIRIHGDPKQWLLIKRNDEGADFPPNPVADQPESVISGKTVEEVGRSKRSRVWHSNR